MGDYCEEIEELEVGINGKRARVGMFVDMPNVNSGLREKSTHLNFRKLSEFARSKGKLTIARAYGIIHANEKLPRSASEADREGFEFVPAIQNPEHEKDIDPRMIVDVARATMDDLLDHYMLATGDADFVPVIRLIHERGKEVTVIPVKGTEAKLLLKVADSVVYADELIVRENNSRVSCSHRDNRNKSSPEKKIYA